MRTKSNVVTGSTVVIVLILVIQLFLTLPGYSHKALVSKGLRNSPQPSNVYAASTFIIEQRNNLSIMLNLKQKKFGQLECEKFAGNKVAITETGGWCQISKVNSGSHKTDMKLVPALTELLNGKYIGSFGDGPGRYKQLLYASGKVKGYDAYDGAPFCETTSEGRVRFLDLTLPQYGLPLYDWVVSLEVAEHIPHQFEIIYIDNIVRHAREGVVLSWARPGQGGYSHVNNRPFEYIKDLMDKFGFSHDNAESQKLKDAASFNWFKWNINVYRRKKMLSAEDMKNFT